MALGATVQQRRNRTDWSNLGLTVRACLLGACVVVVEDVHVRASHLHTHCTVMQIVEHTATSILGDVSTVTTGLFNTIGTVAGNAISSADGILEKESPIVECLQTDMPQHLRSHRGLRGNLYYTGVLLGGEFSVMLSPPVADAVVAAPVAVSVASAEMQETPVAPARDQEASVYQSSNAHASAQKPTSPFPTSVPPPQVSNYSTSLPHGNAGGGRGEFGKLFNGGIFTPPQQLEPLVLDPRQPQLAGAVPSAEGTVQKTGQRGFVGLNLTKSQPFVVLGAQDIMDHAGVLQGNAGYSNVHVQPGDQLVRVDGHGVEFCGIKSLQHMLGGQLGSIVELVFSRNGSLFSIRALRHAAGGTGQHISLNGMHAGHSMPPRLGLGILPPPPQAPVVVTPGVSGGGEGSVEVSSAPPRGHVQTEVDRLRQVPNTANLLYSM